MNSTPHIFLDLDECLIHSLYGASSNKTRTRIDLGVNDSGRKEIYSSILRATALELIASSRALAPTRLLTTATRDYALAHNDIFNLGFAEKEIIAREDYILESPTAYGGSTRTVLASRQFPKSLLVDNLPHDSESSQLKCIYLGIDRTRYFQIREFYGAKDPDSFCSELSVLISNISEKLSSEQVVPTGLTLSPQHSIVIDDGNKTRSRGPDKVS